MPQKVTTDSDLLCFLNFLVDTEGIIPALESSHAVAYAKKLAALHSNAKILVNLSGRGDKDIQYVLDNM